jgi:thymidylate kinase
MRRARAVVVAVEGVSGSGKSTLVARASAKFGWVPLAEAYDRLDPRPAIGVRSAPALARVERLLFEEDRRRFEAARALARRGTTVLADTGFLGPLTYTAGLVALGTVPPEFERELLGRARRWARTGRWGAPDAVVYLETRAATRRRRSAGDAKRHPAGLTARHERVGRLENRFYTEQLPQVLPGRVRCLDAERPLDRLVPALARIVRNVTPLGDRSRIARRMLALFPEFPTERPRAEGGRR